MISLDAVIAGADLSPLTTEDIRALLCQISAAQTRIAAHIAAQPAGEDHLLDVEEAAEKLGVDPQWIYRRTRRLPFVVRMDGAVRFSARGIDRFIAARQGR